MIPRIWFEREPHEDYRDHIAVQVEMLGPGTANPEAPFEALGRANGILAGSWKYTDEVMAMAPELIVIGRMGIGVDSVDLEAATRRGVAVCNAPTAPTISTAEHAVLLILVTAKNLDSARSLLRSGADNMYQRHEGVELAGKTLGLVGLGRIARRVAAIAGAMEMNVIAHDPFVEDAPHGVSMASSLDEALAVADVVSVHVPLTEMTYRMFDDVAFARMKRGAAFINTARGGLVDQDALLRALRSGAVRCAGLDVTDPEPLPADHPLLAHDRVVVTPHVATATDGGKAKNFAGAYRQVVAVFDGKRPDHLVNPDVWPRVERRIESMA